MRIVRVVASILWHLSEWSGIGLGRFAPYILGLMIGSQPVKKVEGE